MRSLIVEAAVFLASLLAIVVFVLPIFRPAIFAKAFACNEDCREVRYAANASPVAKIFAYFTMPLTSAKVLLGYRCSAPLLIREIRTKVGYGILMFIFLKPNFLYDVVMVVLVTVALVPILLFRRLTNYSPASS